MDREVAEAACAAAAAGSESCYDLRYYEIFGVLPSAPPGHNPWAQPNSVADARSKRRAAVKAEVNRLVSVTLVQLSSSLGDESGLSDAVGDLIALVAQRRASVGAHLMAPGPLFVNGLAHALSLDPASEEAFERLLCSSSHLTVHLLDLGRSADEIIASHYADASVCQQWGRTWPLDLMSDPRDWTGAAGEDRYVLAESSHVSIFLARAFWTEVRAKHCGAVIPEFVWRFSFLFTSPFRSARHFAPFLLRSAARARPPARRAGGRH